ncbi:MAG TPA: sulfotransferase, partial [Herpetosiphonaceae bacterium]
MAHGPIFLAGIERSGTSLMYALLASHPNIAMTRRTNFWRFFYGQYGDLRDPANFERCLAAMLRYKRHLKLQPDPERIRREFWHGQPSYARLFALLEEHHAERLGKVRWGDKSLNNEHYVDMIFADYPDARMIQMVRDPRDRFASAITRWKTIRGRIGTGAARWRRSVEQGQHNAERYPDRYLIVRYETLVEQPEATLRQVCAFIGEPYTPAMLTMEG